MKRIFFIVAMLMTTVGMNAQDCATIMLPFFGGDQERMAEYPAEKLEWRCNYARNAFYVTDEIPAKAVLYTIDEVKDKWTGEALPRNFSVNLNTFSYYAYNFIDIQHRFKDLNTTICFETPGSEHRYLVLRSLNDIYNRTEFGTKNDNQ
ncbi:MAG: hypothetical protein IKP21_03030 [Bacteroidales bacterium]|nr:hypothetical protein [Bacteroidales bacterium]